MRKLKMIALAVFLQIQFGAAYVFAQVPQAENITHQERLRGSVTLEREWWDLLQYQGKIIDSGCSRRLESLTLAGRSQFKIQGAFNEESH